MDRHGAIAEDGLVLAVSVGVPTRMPKSRRSPLEAEWRWTQESEGGGTSWTRDSIAGRRITVSSGIVVDGECEFRK